MIAFSFIFLMRSEIVFLLHSNELINSTYSNRAGDFSVFVALMKI